MTRMHRSLAWAWVAGWIALAAPVLAGTTHPSPEAVQPLAAGQSIPAATVHSVKGEPVELQSLVRDEGALLVFYRGGW